MLARQASPYAERLSALKALLRLGDAGKAAVRNVLETQLGNSVNDLRLRAEVVQALYGDSYGPDDVIALVEAVVLAQGTVSSGMLWSLADAVPERDLPAILDGIEPPGSEQDGPDRRLWDTGSFYARILVRAWSNPGLFEPARVMGWLHKRAAFGGGHSQSRARDLRTAMRAAPERLRALAEDSSTACRGTKTVGSHSEYSARPPCLN